MNAVTLLLTDHIGIWTAAENEKKSGRGRSVAGSVSVYGIKKLRELIVELAVRGKLVPQDPTDEPASLLLARLSQKGDAKSKTTSTIKSDLAPQQVEGLQMPSGWECARLDQLCAYIQRGKGPVYDDAGSALVVSQKCVQWSGFDIALARPISDQSLEKYDEVRFLKDGDVLWNSTGTGTVGRVAIFSNKTSAPVVADSHVTVLRAKENIVSFLIAFLSSPLIQDRMSPEAEKPLVSGTTNQVELNTTAVKALVVPLPPLAEQHRIVAKVDELMALCDQLEAQHSDAADAHEKLVKHLLGTLTNSENAEDFAANWQRIAAHFDTLFTTEASIDLLKQTILQLAVMGKLVPQDPNDEPANELLRRVGAIRDRNDSVDKYALPRTWSWSYIEDCFTVSGGIQKTPSRAPKNNAFPYLGVGNVYRNRLELSSIKQFELSNGELEKFSLCPNDILVVEGNGSASEIGRCAIWHGEIENCVHQNHLIRCRPKDSQLTPYTALYLNSPAGMAEMTRLAITSAGLFSLSVGKIRKIVFPLPPLREQDRIVAKVDVLMVLCDGIRSQLNAANQIQQKLAEALVAQAVA